MPVVYIYEVPDHLYVCVCMNYSLQIFFKRSEIGVVMDIYLPFACIHMCIPLPQLLMVSTFLLMNYLTFFKVSLSPSY